MLIDYVSLWLLFFCVVVVVLQFPILSHVGFFLLCISVPCVFRVCFFLVLFVVIVVFLFLLFVVGSVVYSC